MRSPARPPSPRVICPICFRSISVRKDLKRAKHVEYDEDGRRAGLCAGSETPAPSTY